MAIAVQMSQSPARVRKTYAFVKIVEVTERYTDPIINDAYQRKKMTSKALKRKGSIGIS